MYDLSNSRARNPLVATIVFIFIGTLTTCLRLRARQMRNLKLGTDDYLILGALFFEYVEIGLQFACILAGGVGRHVADVAPADVVKTLKLILPFEALYGVILSLVKGSIIFFYLRIFGAKPGFRISAFCVLGFIILWAVSIILETFLLCRPLAFNWDSSIKGICGDRNTVYVSAGALNVVTDFMVMALPIPHILKLQLAFKRKIGLIVMFSLGLFITAISILRIKSLQLISFTDPTYTLPMGLFWTTLEPCLAIINANLPMVRTFLIGVAPGLFGSTNDQSKANHATITYGSRSNNFELLGEDGTADVKLGQIRTENIIRGGRSSRNALDHVDTDSAADDDSQRRLKGGSGVITVNRTVDIETF